MPRATGGIGIGRLSRSGADRPIRIGGSRYVPALEDPVPFEVG